MDVVKHNTSGHFISKQSIEIEFAFENILTPGDYMLVLAIEHRNGDITEYVEYIEDASMFKVVSESNSFFSIVKPSVVSKFI